MAEASHPLDSNAGYTLFDNKTMTGRIKRVIKGGEILVDGDDFLGKQGKGNYIETRTGEWFPM